MLHRFAMAIVYHVTTLKRKPQFSLFYFSPLTFPFFPALRFIYPSPTVYFSPSPLRISPPPLRISPAPLLASPPPRFAFPRPAVLSRHSPRGPRRSSCPCPAPVRPAAVHAARGSRWREAGRPPPGWPRRGRRNASTRAKRRAFCPPTGRLEYERVRAAKRRRIGGTGMQLPGRWRNGPAAGDGAEGAERAPDENAPPGVAGGAGERQGGVSLRRAPRARPDRRAAPPRRSRSAGAARRHIRPARCRPPCRSRRPR